MALLLRRVWLSVMDRTNSSSSSAASSSSDSSNELGFRQEQQQPTSSFHSLPADVLVLIFKFLGPKDAARMRVVCKQWKVLISDNQLWVFFLRNEQDSWESIVFAETQLRSGYPLRTKIDTVNRMSLMSIYGQRAEPSGAIIIDGGSGYCKYGWSKYPYPSARAATFMEFGNIEAPTYSSLRHFFSTIYSRMQVKPSGRPVIVSLPICHNDDTHTARASRRQLKEMMYSVLFDMHVPAACAINQAVLALFAARCTSGIVVNIGFQVTSIVPILHGKVMHEIGVETIGQGALRLTSFLADQLRRKGIRCDSMYTVRTLKENLCYVALDYEAEMRKDTSASMEVMSDGWFTLSKERFQTGEILFQPQLGGMRTMGLHRAVALCMDHCANAYVGGNDYWFRTVVLAGGSACLPGLSERLEKELYDILPAHISHGVNVLPPPYGAESAWFGAKILSNVSTFKEKWCLVKKQRSRQHRSSRAV